MNYTNYIDKICLKCIEIKELPVDEKFCRTCETRLIEDEDRYIIEDDHDRKEWETVKKRLTAGYTEDGNAYKGIIYHNNFRKEVIYNLKKLIEKINTATEEDFITFLSNWKEEDELELTPGAIIRYNYIFRNINVEETPLEEIKDLILNYLVHTLLVEQFNLDLFKSL